MPGSLSPSWARLLRLTVQSRHTAASIFSHPEHLSTCSLVLAAEKCNVATMTYYCVHRMRNHGVDIATMITVFVVSQSLNRVVSVHEMRLHTLLLRGPEFEHVYNGMPAVI